MKITRTTQLVLAVLLAGVCCLQSCKEANGEAASKGETPEAEVIAPDVQEPQNVIHGMPSALHHSEYLLIGEANFNEALPLVYSDFTIANDKFSKALLLGMYQADLGYAIAHDEKTATLGYFEAIKALGDDLGLFHRMEDDMIENAERNIDDAGALHDILMNAMQEAEIYLHQEEGHEIADLMATGIWLENSYLSTQILKEQHDPTLMQRIGEDKLILPRIIEDLKKHQGDAQMDKLIKRLEKAEKVYANIEIEHNNGEHVTDTVAGVTQIGNTHRVKFSQKRLGVITKIIAAIRNGYTKQQES